MVCDPPKGNKSYIIISIEKWKFLRDPNQQSGKNVRKTRKITLKRNIRVVLYKTLLESVRDCLTGIVR